MIVDIAAPVAIVLWILRDSAASKKADADFQKKGSSLE